MTLQLANTLRKCRSVSCHSTQQTLPYKCWYLLRVISQKDLNLPGLDEESQHEGTGETEAGLTLSCLFVGLRDFSRLESKGQKEGCTDQPLILWPFTKWGEMTLGKCLRHGVGGGVEHRNEKGKVSGEICLLFFHCLHVLIVLGTIHWKVLGQVASQKTAIKETDSQLFNPSPSSESFLLWIYI